MDMLEVAFWICIALVFYTYIGYGIVLYLMVKVKELFVKRKIAPSFDEASLPEVTLLVAAYNEEDVVEEKMKNSLALDYPADKLHFMWVTDGSTDQTNTMLERYGCVKILYQSERQGKTSALNRAMDYVKTSIVVFTDANTMINRESIREIVACFEDSKVGCVAGEKRIAMKEKDNAAGGGEGLYWKYESALKRLDGRLYSAMGAAGELFSIRTELFEKMDSDTLLDDFILSMRIVQRGYKIAYCAEAYAIENGSADMNEERKRKVRIAAGGLQSIWRLRELMNVFKHGIVSFQYVSHRVLRWSVTPLALFTLLPLNVLLVFMSENPVYGVLLVAQILFYALAYGGYVLSKKQIKNKYLYVPYYFTFMNINVVKGVFYLNKKKGSGTWEKAKRA